MANREFTVEDEYPYNRSGPVRWITSHMMRYPVFPLLALLAAIVNNVAYSGIALAIGRAFDLISSPAFLDSNTIQPMVGLAITVGVLAVIQGVSGLMRNYSVAFLAQRIERDTREELYVSLLGKSQTFHGRQRIGDIMARATNDVRSLNFMFSPGLMLILDSLMGLVVPFILIARIDTRLLPVPLLFYVGLAVTVWDYNRRLRPVSEAMREQFGTLNAGLAEAISGIDVVKSNVMEHYEWNKFTGNARLFRDYFVKQGEIQAFYLPVLVFTFAWAGAFLLGLLQWRAGVISLGEVVAYLGLIATLRFPTFISIFTFNLVQMGLASARRILQLINTETEMDENVHGIAQPIRGEVAFEGVTFAYDGLPVLKDITFTAHPGETIAIVGQTGSGKTTLTRLINRIFDADTGRVLVDGADVREWSMESLRSQISAIEQDPFLFTKTLSENIAFGRSNADMADIKDAARAAQAHDFISEFEDGYLTEVGERGETLSGGQRQRIAIARAFLTDPRILILDDSTSAIDSATEDQIQRAMRNISRARTTFLITHRLSQIRWADRILVLRGGELVDQGTHDELMARSADYRRIFAGRDDPAVAG